MDICRYHHLDGHAIVADKFSNRYCYSTVDIFIVGAYVPNSSLLPCTRHHSQVIQVIRQSKGSELYCAKSAIMAAPKKYPHESGCVVVHYNGYRAQIKIGNKTSLSCWLYSLLCLRCDAV